MTENEQIEELEKDIDSGCDGDCILPCTECTARHLFKIGYRKVERGEWVKKNGVAVCSKCGNDKPIAFETISKTIYYNCNYCRFCGADMRGEEEWIINTL